MAELGTANIGGRAVPAWVLESTAEQVDNSKWFSRPNLLDNWYFPQAVNQRGDTSWNERGYHLDRWYEEQNVAGSIGTDGYHIGTGQTVIQAHSEEEMNQLLGKTITISCLLSDGSFATATGTLPDELTENFNIVCYPKSGFEFMMALFYSAKGYQFGRISNGSGSEITVVACKTELGSQQTLAHQDEDGNWVLNEVPNYAEELAKCQQYYYRSDMRYSARPVYNNRYLNIPVQFPVTMRILPTVTVKSFAGTANMLSVWESSLDANISVMANTPDVSKDGIGSFNTGADMDLNTVYGFFIEASADL